MSGVLRWFYRYDSEDQQDCRVPARVKWKPVDVPCIVEAPGLTSAQVPRLFAKKCHYWGRQMKNTRQDTATFRRAPLPGGGNRNSITKSINPIGNIAAFA